MKRELKITIWTLCLAQKETIVNFECIPQRPGSHPQAENRPTIELSGRRLGKMNNDRQRVHEEEFLCWHNWQTAYESWPVSVSLHQLSQFWELDPLNFVKPWFFVVDFQLHIHNFLAGINLNDWQPGCWTTQPAVTIIGILINMMYLSFY